jgi:hypothetical protein
MLHKNVSATKPSPKNFGPGTTAWVEHMKRQEKMAKRREQVFTVKKALSEAGMSMRLWEVPSILKDVLTIQHVMHRRTGNKGLYEAAKVYPAVLKVYEDMKHLTPHTVIAAAARRYFADQERQKWQEH